MDARNAILMSVAGQPLLASSAMTSLTTWPPESSVAIASQMTHFRGSKCREANAKKKRAEKREVEERRESESNNIIYFGLI